MNGTTNDGGGASLATFIINEMRDVRRSQEQSNNVITTKMTEMSNAIMSLGARFDSSHESLQEVRKDVGNLNIRVGEIETLRGKEEVAKSSAWSGPRKVVLFLGAIGGVAGSLLAIKAVWPALFIL